MAHKYTLKQINNWAIFLILDLNKNVLKYLHR